MQKITTQKQKKNLSLNLVLNDVLTFFSDFCSGHNVDLVEVSLKEHIFKRIFLKFCLQVTVRYHHD